VELVGGNVVGFGFVIELEALGGRSRLRPYDVHALLTYE
jgi:adenine/guanine phosphoribosyltransferase-like PRPP-binding protein